MLKILTKEVYNMHMAQTAGEIRCKLIPVTAKKKTETKLRRRNFKKYLKLQTFIFGINRNNWVKIYIKLWFLHP